MTDQSMVISTRRSGIVRLIQRACAALALIAWALVSAHSARADTLLISPTELFTGETAAGYQVDVPGPGTLFVDLFSNDYAKGVRSDLSLVLADGSDVLGSLTDVKGYAQLPTLTIGSATTLFAYVVGEATGRLDIGMYTLSVVFRADGSDPSPVPLPPSIWLLLGGLVAVGGMLRYGMPRLRTPSATSTV